MLAAGTLGDRAVMAQAAAALGRCLYWQGRSDEAAGVLRGAGDACGSPADAARVALTMARVHLSEGAIPPAVRAARHALDLAAGSGEPRTLASASRVLAAAVAAAGDAGFGARAHPRRPARREGGASSARGRAAAAHVGGHSDRVGRAARGSARGRQAGGHRGPAAASAEIPGPCGPRARGAVRVSTPRRWRSSTAPARSRFDERSERRRTIRSPISKRFWIWVTPPATIARRSSGSAASCTTGCAPRPILIVTAAPDRRVLALVRPAVARRSARGLARARQRAERGGGPFRRAVSGGRAAAVRRRDDRRRGGALDGGDRARRGPRDGVAPRRRARRRRERARAARSRASRQRRGRGRGGSARRQRTRAHAARGHRARRARAVSRADRRGERQRQGARGARDSPARPAARSPVLRAQLRGAVGRSDRGRAVRPRARRVHRRGGRAPRPLRGGGRRHAVPRRNRRAVGAGPGQAAARAPGRRGPPRRGERLAPRRRADRRGDQPAARAGSVGRPVPRGPAIPARRGPHRRAAAPGPRRRRAAARVALLERCRRAHGLARHAVARGHRGARALRLARQRARAAERHRLDGRALAAARPHRRRRLAGAPRATRRSRRAARSRRRGRSSSGGSSRPRSPAPTASAPGPPKRSGSRGRGWPR